MVIILDNRNLMKNNKNLYSRINIKRMLFLYNKILINKLHQKLIRKDKTNLSKSKV